MVSYVALENEWKAPITVFRSESEANKAREKLHYKIVLFGSIDILRDRKMELGTSRFLFPSYLRLWL